MMANADVDPTGLGRELETFRIDVVGQNSWDVLASWEITDYSAVEAVRQIAGFERAVYVQVRATGATLCDVYASCPPAAGNGFEHIGRVRIW